MSNFRPPFREDMTLKEAQDLLRPMLKEGHACPVCTQMAKIYRFSVNSAISRALILMYRKNGKGWVDVPTLGLPGGHFAKLRFWGLIAKPDGAVRDDGSSRVGTWRVTDAGEAWLQRTTTIPKYALIYNNRCLGVEGKPVGIEEALGRRFNYSELMAGV